MMDLKYNLRILSLNVYYGHLADELSQYIGERMQQASVLCFQETNERALGVIEAILGEDFVGIHASKPGKGDTHYLSTYVRRGIDIPEKDLLCGDVDGAGFALRTRLVDDHGYSAVVTNVYGTPRPNDKLDSPERIMLTSKVIEGAARSAETEIIVGDFNLMPHTESIRMFEAHGFRSLIEEYSIPTTRNEVAWQKFPPHMKQLYADYAFIRGEGVGVNFVVEDVTVSDHLPLVLDVFQPLHSPQAPDRQTTAQSVV